ncbi:MAG: hypothetical protein GQ574_04565 [Crocinitomix sp.]|nr:hypothetical protein [Crocinitomix sp.]
MARPIDLNEAKTLIHNYHDYGSDRHFDLNTVMISGYKYKRHELISLMGVGQNDELIIMLALDISAAHLRLVLGKLVSNQIDVNSMIIDSHDPCVDQLIIQDPFSENENDNKKAGRGEVILPAHLRTDHDNHINRNFSDTLRNVTFDQIRAYVVEHDDLTSIGLLDPVTPANSSDEFLLMPITRSTDHLRTLNSKPYLSFAFAKVINGTVQNIAREYFSPCPNDCTDYYTYFH